MVQQRAVFFSISRFLLNDNVIVGALSIFFAALVQPRGEIMVH